MFGTTASTGLSSHRLIDPNAIDITSLKGQFAWERIAQCDSYLPVIFRGDTRYFCVRMLRQILSGYPEDVIRRSYQYQYRKTIDIYSVTACEVDLLNRINGQHSRWAFSRQPFTALDEIVRVSDFFPFYEHLRRGSKSTPALSNVTMHTLRQLLPQSVPSAPAQILQRSPDPIAPMPLVTHRQSNMPQAPLAQIQSHTPPTIPAREPTSSNLRPTPSAPKARQQKSVGNPYAVVLPARLTQQSASPPPPPQARAQPPPPSLSNGTTHHSNTVLPNRTATTVNVISVSTLPTASTSSSSPPAIPSSVRYSPASSSSPTLPSPAPVTVHRKSTTSSTLSSPLPLSTTATIATTPTTATTTPSPKSARLYSGWLQVNKLYTPYIAASATNYHQYKLPVSLLSFYELLRVPSSEINDSNNESQLPYEQTTATAQELELINELCVKQHIKPFGADTKLIQLSTFYQYSSASILFVKELPNEEPKASICKEWASIVQINGGICRLRNIATLHEQTVPFIGNNLLKSFILSTQCLSTASLSKPTPSELEFLQLILFFSNLSINLRNPQLIDIDSVKKEYNVDLILLFNDKFPLNVLNYQQQGNRANASQVQMMPSNPTAPTNTIAESTPPPSPPSSPTNQPQTTGPSQLPLTSSNNRYYKTIQFHGHTLTAYICSGLGSNSQRECVAIKSLCNILYPDSPSLDRLEVKMLRLLRLKNINRFRPQNQQSLGFTRLIDIRDAETHWNYLEQGLRSLMNDSEEKTIRPSLSTVSDENARASTMMESVEMEEQPPAEPSVEVNRGEKRPLHQSLDEEDIPVLERISKRVRFAERDNTTQVIEPANSDDGPLNGGKTMVDVPLAEKSPKKITIKLPSLNATRRSLMPSSRIKREIRATWATKYDIEDCCIQLNRLESRSESERD